MQRYRLGHRNRLNLGIHLIMVPVFIGGALLGLVALVLLQLVLGTLAVLMIGLSLALQGFGHRREEVPPEPFAGPGDFTRRIVVEQFVTFPRFVLRGDWSRAWNRRGPET